MSLISTARAVRRRALRTGALEPIATTLHAVPDAGIPFEVRVTGPVERRPKRPGDPFDPPEPELVVCELPRHVVVLNKFPVFDDHLLIVTRDWRDQDEPLDRFDLDALFAVLDEVGGTGFYNGGTVAGASQPHRHVQVVPWQASVEAAVASGSYPVPHRAAPRGDFATYERLLDGWTGPHNLVATSRWMWVVRRRREVYDGVGSVNGLGYAGSLLVRDATALRAVRDVGPAAVLRALA